MPSDPEFYAVAAQVIAVLLLTLAVESGILAGAGRQRPGLTVYLALTGLLALVIGETAALVGAADNAHFTTFIVVDLAQPRDMGVPKLPPYVV